MISFPFQRAILLLVAVVLGLAGCAAMAPAERNESELRAQAESAYLGEDYAAAEQALARLAAEQPEDVQVWFRLANIYGATQRLESAARAYRHVLELEPERARARHNLGLIYIELGVQALLEARRALPAVDEQAAGSMQYLACVMQTFMGHPNPPTCRVPEESAQ